MRILTLAAGLHYISVGADCVQAGIKKAAHGRADRPINLYLRFTGLSKTLCQRDSPYFAICT